MRIIPLLQTALLLIAALATSGVVERGERYSVPDVPVREGVPAEIVVALVLTMLLQGYRIGRSKRSEPRTTRPETGYAVSTAPVEQSELDRLIHRLLHRVVERVVGRRLAPALMQAIAWLLDRLVDRILAKLPGGSISPAPSAHVLPVKTGAHDFDLFVLYAPADAAFVHGYLLRMLDPDLRVLLIDNLTPGAFVASEIERGVARSRFTVTVLSPAYMRDCWAMFGEQLASHLSVRDTRVIPLRLANCELPLRLQARVALDFTDPATWTTETARLRALLGRALAA